MLTLSKGFDDQNEIDKGEEDTSSFSNLEKMRRKPFSLRKSLSTSLRFL